MEFIKEKTCAFSGYRPHKFPFAFKENSIEVKNLSWEIEEAICGAAKAGYDTFLCGMSHGFDLLCAEAVLKLRSHYFQYPYLRLIAVIPFEGHKDYWDKVWQIKYEKALRFADKTIYTSERYNRGCYFIRNRFLVDNAGLLICYYDGLGGGTAYTVDYAGEKGIAVVNLALDEDEAEEE